MCWWDFKPFFFVFKVFQSYVWVKSLCGRILYLQIDKDYDNKMERESTYVNLSNIPFINEQSAKETLIM